MTLQEALHGMAALKDLNDEQIGWLSSHVEERRLSPGDILAQEGAPADAMFFVLEGTLRIQRDNNGAGDSGTLVVEQGEVTGKLPYSRMKEFGRTVRADTPAWTARLPESDFEELLRLAPQLQQRFVSMMADRIREVTRNEQQYEKLSALGKLSAGLAHEMNNPAAAAKRAAAGLQDMMARLKDANDRLDELPLTHEQRKEIGAMERTAGKRMENAPSMSGLELSDLEQELGEWLEQRGIENAWDLAPVIAEAGVQPGEFDELAKRFECKMLGPVLTRVSSTVAADRLVAEIQTSIGRITDLVGAIKEYSYMDQAPEQEIDVHDGLESTLTIMAYKLRSNKVNVVREYDRSLPHVCAFGSELNQVWTNLIDNAADAMPEGGTLKLVTRRDATALVVEVEDSGPGVPEEVQEHIFEPFFTTKPVGEGTGLGLDTALRVIKKHRGEITLDSKPGETHFVVRLPSCEEKRDI